MKLSGLSVCKIGQKRSYTSQYHLEGPIGAWNNSVFIGRNSNPCKNRERFSITQVVKLFKHYHGCAIVGLEMIFYYAGT